MVEVEATQFELIMHNVETRVIKSFWANYLINNERKPSKDMIKFLEDNMKWTVGETFKRIMVDIFDDVDFNIKHE